VTLALVASVTVASVVRPHAAMAAPPGALGLSHEPLHGIDIVEHVRAEHLQRPRFASTRYLPTNT
jgi:hypothetical protein